MSWGSNLFFVQILDLHKKRPETGFIVQGHLKDNLLELGPRREVLLLDFAKWNGNPEPIQILVDGWS